MTKIIRGMVGLGLCLALLTACDNTSDDGSQPATIAPTRTLIPPTATPTPPPPDATLTPTDLPSPASLRPTTTTTEASSRVQRIVNRLIEDLISEHQADPSDIRLLSVNTMIWRDSTWSCPAHSDNQPAGPTAGYRIVFSTGSRVFVFHTDFQDAFFVCPEADWLALRGQPVILEPIAQAMVDFGKQDAARRFEVAADTVELVSLLTLTWPDASMGCPKPGGDYDNIATPGYRFVLRVQAESLIYHASSREVVFCSPDEEILPGLIRQALPTEVTPTPAP